MELVELPYLPSLNTHLKTLYEQNKINAILDIIKEKCLVSTAMHGASTVGFRSSTDNSIIYKVVPIGVGLGYFESFPNDKLDNFLHKIKNNDCILPIISIEYVDEYAFVYIQKYVEKLKKKDLYTVLSVFILIYKMLLNDLITSDIGVGNFGLFENDILLFDLQGLRNYLKTDKERLTYHFNKYRKISEKIKNTHNYISIYFEKIDRSDAINLVADTIIKFWNYHSETFDKQQINIIKKKLSPLNVFKELFTPDISAFKRLQENTVELSIDNPYVIKFLNKIWLAPCWNLIKIKECMEELISLMEHVIKIDKPEQKTLLLKTKYSDYWLKRLGYNRSNESHQDLCIKHILNGVFPLITSLQSDEGYKNTYFNSNETDRNRYKYNNAFKNYGHGPISVSINRSNELNLIDGTHRIAILLALGHKKFPVYIHVRNINWINLKKKILSNPEKYKQYWNHPDINITTSA